MSQTTITVADITPPEIGKKQGKITDTEGNRWNCWADKLQNYRMGVTYDIVYETNEFNNKQYNVIKTANPSNAAPRVAAPKSSDDWPGPAPRQAPPSSQQVAPNAKDEMIFVCGIVNNAMANTNINPFIITLTELIAMVDKARSAWRNTLGKAQNAGDINDEIPDFR